jgi:hypothetical protein
MWPRRDQKLEPASASSTMRRAVRDDQRSEMGDPEARETGAHGRTSHTLEAVPRCTPSACNTDKQRRGFECRPRHPGQARPLFIPASEAQAHRAANTRWCPGTAGSQSREGLPSRFRWDPKPAAPRPRQAPRDSGTPPLHAANFECDHTAAPRRHDCCARCRDGRHYPHCGRHGQPPRARTGASLPKRVTQGERPRALESPERRPRPGRVIAK